MGGIEEALSAAERIQTTKDLLAVNDQFLTHLPKVELHLHIEGTLTPELRWALAHRNNQTLRLARTNTTYTSVEQLAASYGTAEQASTNDEERFTFFEAYYGGFEVLVEDRDFYDLAMAYFERAAGQNVRYCEVFFDPQGHTRRGVSWGTMMGGLDRARADAEAKFGLKSNWIMCILRDMSPSSAMETYLSSLPHRASIIGMGLDSDEESNPPQIFAEVFARARADGYYRLTAHCDVGMSGAAANIAYVGSSLGGGGRGADRIDHGLDAAADEALMKSIREKETGLTITPYGYLRHRSADEVFGRIGKLFRGGVRIAIGSDDPAYMEDAGLLENLLWVKKYCGLGDGAMAKMARDAVGMCWAEEEVKRAILGEIDEVVDRYAVL